MCIRDSFKTGIMIPMACAPDTNDDVVIEWMKLNAADRVLSSVK